MIRCTQRKVSAEETGAPNAHQRSHLRHSALYCANLPSHQQRRDQQKGKGSPYSIIERRVPELIPVFCSQPASDVSHKPGGRLLLLSARPAVTLATLKKADTSFVAWRTEARWVWTVFLRLLPDSVAAAIWNPGPSAPESRTLTTRIPSHQQARDYFKWILRPDSCLHCSLPAPRDKDLIAKLRISRKFP